MKKPIVATLLMLSVCGCMSKFTTHDINIGMTRDDVYSKLGKPEGRAFKDGKEIIYFEIHDHAFGNDKNHYAFIFKDDKLVEYFPVSEETRESTTIIPIYH